MLWTYTEALFISTIIFNRDCWHSHHLAFPKNVLMDVFMSPDEKTCHGLMELGREVSVEVDREIRIMQKRKSRRHINGGVKYWPKARFRIHRTFITLWSNCYAGNLNRYMYITLLDFEGSSRSSNLLGY